MRKQTAKGNDKIRKKLMGRQGLEVGLHRAKNCKLNNGEWAWNCPKNPIAQRPPTTFYWLAKIFTKRIFLKKCFYFVGQNFFPNRKCIGEGKGLEGDLEEKLIWADSDRHKNLPTYLFYESRRICHRISEVCQRCQKISAMLSSFPDFA